MISNGVVCQGSADSLHPPASLLKCPPLAVYCNALLTAFNDLRLCAPLSLADDTAALVQQSLSSAALVLLSYHRSVVPVLLSYHRLVTLVLLWYYWSVAPVLLSHRPHAMFCVLRVQGGGSDAER